MAAYIRNKRRIIKRVKKDCIFCKQKKEPDYKDIESLRRYVSERGKIVGNRYTGVCHKHQLHLTIAIKRARFLALLPFLVRPS